MSLRGMNRSFAARFKSAENKAETALNSKSTTPIPLIKIR